MIKHFELGNFKQIHFIGVGGVSMSALAQFCLRRGKIVSGSDRVYSTSLENLSKMGAKIYIGHDKNNVKTADLVVYSSALDSNNPELRFSIDNKITVLKRSQFLGEILKVYKNVIAVSGCHGKTTTTAMIGEVLTLAGYNPTIFLGGEHRCYGNFRMGEKEFAVVEACEYQKNFLDIYHTFSLVLNIDVDHMECYNGVDDLVHTYSEFCSETVKAVGSDSLLCGGLLDNAITFAIDCRARFTAKNIVFEDGKCRFDVFDYNVLLGDIKLNVLGYHNVYNALATVSACSHFNVAFKFIKQGIENFSNVKRRFEKIGKIGKAHAICDYAHHPEELKQTINAVIKTNKKTLFVFQPHTYSRTKLLMNDFIKVLKEVDDLIIYKTYPARERYDKKASAKALYKNLLMDNSKVEYCSTREELKRTIDGKILSKDYQLICFLGAGDVYEIAKTFCKSKKVADSLN